MMRARFKKFTPIVLFACSFAFIIYTSSERKNSDLIIRAFQTAMTFLDFRGDDCKGCLETDYRVILQPRNLCHQGKEQPSLLLLVSTTFGERHVRDLVRKTWLASAMNNMGDIRYVFLIGKSQDDGLKDDLAPENQEYNDILQHDYTECVRNMTLKTISGFRWVTRHCPAIPHIMKVDTDIWLNVPKWQEFITERMGKTQVEQAMVGYCIEGGYVVRFPLHRYFVSHEAYSKMLYPPYCAGPAYYLPRKLVTDIARVSYKEEFIPIEDAFIGICLQRLGYGVRPIPGVLRFLDHGYPRSIDQFLGDPCFIAREVYAIHNIGLADLALLWKKTENCSLYG